MPLGPCDTPSPGRDKTSARLLRCLSLLLGRKRALETRKPPQDMTIIPPPALAYYTYQEGTARSASQATNQPGGQSLGCSSHVAVRAPLSGKTQTRTQGEALGCLAQVVRLQPPCLLETRGRHRPAGLSPKPGRPRPQSVLSLALGLFTRPAVWLAGWLGTEVCSAARPRGTIRASQLAPSNKPRASCRDLWPHIPQFAEGHVGGRDQGYNVGAWCSL